MFDPPHLMKSLRNNFKRNGFKNGEHDISWNFIEKFYEMDSALPIRMAPKLTKRHITIPAFADLSVKLAMQALSHTVAAGIYTMVQLKALDPVASATADFIDYVDKLFNYFNSRNLYRKGPMAHPLSPSSGHVSFLQID
ncbi:transposable element P transposase-like Protein [Elysia marginata]|uniref:Transposable element P transposase-like Protein n=1 Tax=Elysia marginata TaxID=1093978 RepID=A0AAV4HWD1_9GAST|nr:transposable element P transposase-like Protein [Elysia marginata]